MRRSHRKSRAGCTQCKQRHVKCSETGPRCHHCQRLGLSCSFSPQTAKHSFSPPSHSLSPATGPETAIEHQPVSIVDLELLHNFSSNIFASSWPGEDVEPDIADRYIQLALTKNYLLHSMLALSALHIYSQDRSRSTLCERASFLHHTALRQVQPHIMNLTEEHSIAVCNFSGLAAAIERADFLLNPCHANDQINPIDKILHCFKLSKGVRTVMSPHWEFLKSSWIGPILRLEDNRDEIRPTLDKSFPMLRIVRCLALAQDNKEEREACLYAADRVFLYIAVLASSLESHPTCVKLVDAWPVEVDSAYEEMAVQRKPVALVILAYYAVLMSMKPNSWWFSGWPEILLESIDRILGEDWAELLRWPKEIIHGRGKFRLPSETELYSTPGNQI